MYFYPNVFYNSCLHCRKRMLNMSSEKSAGLVHALFHSVLHQWIWSNLCIWWSAILWSGCGIDCGKVTGRNSFFSSLFHYWMHHRFMLHIVFVGVCIFSFLSFFIGYSIRGCKIGGSNLWRYQDSDIDNWRCYWGWFFLWR